MESIPERRGAKTGGAGEPASQQPVAADGIKVWRCKVCGYLCARTEPPEVCPICKVGRERFELFRLERSP